MQVPLGTGRAYLCNVGLRIVELTGLVSKTDRFSISSVARTARSGFLFGLAYGGIQDLLGLARGRPIGYVDFVRRRLGKATSSADPHDASTSP